MRRAILPSVVIAVSLDGFSLFFSDDAAVVSANVAVPEDGAPRDCVVAANLLVTVSVDDDSSRAVLWLPTLRGEPLTAAPVHDQAHAVGCCLGADLLGRAGRCGYALAQLPPTEWQPALAAEPKAVGWAADQPDARLHLELPGRLFAVFGFTCEKNFRGDQSHDHEQLRDDAIAAFLDVNAEIALLGYCYQQDGEAGAPRAHFCRPTMRRFVATHCGNYEFDDAQRPPGWNRWLTLLVPR